MLPISRGRLALSGFGLIACSYAISWVLTPGPGTGPVHYFAPTFGTIAAPVVVTPPPSTPPSVVKPLQANRYEPI